VIETVAVTDHVPVKAVDAGISADMAISLTHIATARLYKNKRRCHYKRLRQRQQRSRNAERFPTF